MFWSTFQGGEQAVVLAIVLRILEPRGELRISVRIYRQIVKDSIGTLGAFQSQENSLG